MLVVLVIRLGGRPLLLGALASNQYFAIRLLLQSFLIVSLRPNQQANIVDSRILRYIHLLFNLGVVPQRIQNERIKILHQVLVSYPHELIKELVALVHHASANLAPLLLELLLGGIPPPIGVFPLLRRLTRKVNEVFVGPDERVRIQRGVLVLELLGCLHQCLQVLGHVRSQHLFVPIWFF